MNFAKPLQRVKQFGKSLKHAFAVGPSNEPLSPEDEVLLEKMATVVVQRGMAVSAALKKGLFVLRNEVVSDPLRPHTKSTGSWILVQVGMRAHPSLRHGGGYANCSGGNTGGGPRRYQPLCCTV